MDESRTNPPALPRNVKLLGWASFANDVASEMIYPLLPQFLITVLGGDKFFLGLIEGIADSTASLIKLGSGAWSDRLARRKGLIVWGYALAALSRPAIGLATAPWQLLALRFGDRIGKGIRTSPRDALIADSTPQAIRGRAFGFHRGMDHLGAALGPVLAWMFLKYWPGELRLMFLLTLIPGVAVLVLLIWGLREPPTAQPPGKRLALTLRPFDRNFKLFLAALVIFTLGNSSDAFLLVRASELGVETHYLPLLWFAFHIVKSGGNLIAGRIVDRLGPRAPLLLGWLWYAAIYLAFGLAASVWAAWGLFLAYGVYYALTEAAEKTAVAALARKERKGLAFGWYNLAIGVGAFPASLLFGAFYQEFGPLAAFGLGAALALVSAMMLLAVRIPAAVENG
jgi:MFS family permease